MCFLISIFLCFALVPKLVPRTVDFHWYWYRILKFWYRDNPNAKWQAVHKKKRGDCRNDELKAAEHITSAIMCYHSSPSHLKFQHVVRMELLYSSNNIKKHLWVNHNNIAYKINLWNTKFDILKNIWGFCPNNESCLDPNDFVRFREEKYIYKLFESSCLKAT